MPRIAKADVYAALDRVGGHMKQAAGEDGVTSRADLAKKSGNLESTEKALFDMFSRFVDHRDHQPGARITDKDIDRTLEYAKENLVAKYDINKNGLSKSEVREMSRVGKLACKLAMELKGAEPTSGQGGMKAAELTGAIGTAVNDLYYMSEGDYPYTPVSAKIPEGQELTNELAISLFKGQVDDFLYEDWDEPFPIAHENWTPQDAASFFADNAVPWDPEDPESVREAEQYGKVHELFAANLTDLCGVRFGPATESGSLGIDRGLYALLLVGKTADGHAVGVMTGSVET